MLPLAGTFSHLAAVGVTSLAHLPRLAPCGHHCTVLAPAMVPGAHTRLPALSSTMAQCDAPHPPRHLFPFRDMRCCASHQISPGNPCFPSFSVFGRPSDPIPRASLPWLAVSFLPWPCFFLFRNAPVVLLQDLALSRLFLPFVVSRLLPFPSFFSRHRLLFSSFFNDRRHFSLLFLVSPFLRVPRSALSSSSLRPFVALPLLNSYAH